VTYTATLPDGHTWELDFSASAVRNARERRGRLHVQQLWEHLEATLTSPDKHVYCGIRDNGGWTGPDWGDKQGMCFCKRVDYRVDHDGNRIPFKSPMAFAIFVNGKDRIFGWDYLDCEDSGQPLGASYRFDEKY
jgi:hypothetical protein